MHGREGTQECVFTVWAHTLLFFYTQEFEVGGRVSCKATFDNTHHPAEVIERRHEGDKGWMYYVHYAECELLGGQA